MKEQPGIGEDAKFFVGKCCDLHVKHNLNKGYLEWIAVDQYRVVRDKKQHLEDDLKGFLVSRNPQPTIGIGGFAGRYYPFRSSGFAGFSDLLLKSCGFLLQ